MTNTDLPQDLIKDLSDAPTLRALRSRVERLNFSADAKSLLLDVAKLTVSVGSTLIAIGRKILSVVFDLVSRFQNLAFGVVIALVLSAVLASIPLLGPAISALLTPIMLAFGIARGALQDFRNATLQAEIDALSQKLSAMSVHMAA